MLKLPQMPPRRDPNNKNDVVQQLAVAQAQLMQMMTQFIQATTTNNNSNNNKFHPHPKWIDWPDF
jgi:hypothetical protein